MLKITIPATEAYDEVANRFIEVKETTLQLEHSLVSLSKWEAIHHKPFLSKTPMTNAETIDYIRCMTVTQNVNPDVYLVLPQRVLKEVTEYIEDPMTATWFSEQKTNKPSREVVTSELIYYWMISFNIPVEFQKWHLNRLLTLIRVCSIKNAPSKKMGQSDVMNQYRELNNARRKAQGKA